MDRAIKIEVFEIINKFSFSINMQRGQDISERLIEFAVSIIRLCQKLPKDYLGTHIFKQLTRSGTSPGANYEEARGAESKSDFAHKLGITLKELKESRYWLKIISKTDYASYDDIQPILAECEELCAIIAKSVITTKS